MARFEIDLGTVELKRKSKSLMAKHEQVVNETVVFGSQKGLEYMKNNAPWTDRTGNARAGLFVVPNTREKVKTIVFSHTVSYGIWLEVRNNGKYQIIMPAVHRTGKQIMASLNRTLDKVT